MNNGVVRFAVVGLGHIGRRHATMIELQEGADLVALADPLFANQPCDWPSLREKAFESAEAMLAATGEQVDVVSICTPNGTHAELAVLAMNHGCHVVIEKPVALNSDDVRHIQAVANAQGVKVFGVMQNRYAPAAQWLKQSMQDRLVGDVLQVHVQCLWNRDERYYQPGSWRGTMALDGGPLFTQFSHFLDILMWVFGRPVVRDAHFVNQAHQSMTEFEDGGVVRLDLPGGAWGTLTFSTAVADQNFESSLTVLGTKGSFRIGGQYMDRLDEFMVEGVERPKMAKPSPANDYGAYKGSAANHHHVYANVMGVLNHGDAIATPIEDGLAVVEVIEEMHRLGRRS